MYLIDFVAPLLTYQQTYWKCFWKCQYEKRIDYSASVCGKILKVQENPALQRPPFVPSHQTHATSHSTKSPKAVEQWLV